MICRNHPEHGELPEPNDKPYISPCYSECPQYMNAVTMASRIVALEATIARLAAFIGGMPDAPSMSAGTQGAAESEEP